MIKQLLRKRLLEHLLTEAEPMKHFHDRVNEVLYNIISIEIPINCYLPDISKNIQDHWIIKQIQSKIQTKINAVIDTDYPKDGSCVLAPLGMLKIQPLKGNPANIIVTAERKEGLMSGMSYYITIYDDRLPTIVLADLKNPNNNSVGSQFEAHINNTIHSHYKVDRSKSFIEKAFISNVVISMSDFSS